VAWARAFRGDEHVSARREAEDEARKLLDEKAGGMTIEDAAALGRFFNTDSRDGVVRHDRFAPAFHGATLQKVVDDLDTFNLQMGRLWSLAEDASLVALDEILKEPAVFPGAGRSLSTTLFYLRDRDRFVPWMDATHRGLAALTGFKGSKRQGGVKAYLAYCAEARSFAQKHGLKPQEIDGVLALAGRVARQREQGDDEADGGMPTIPTDAFVFLSELRQNNSGEWMSANRVRYRDSLREPFRELMQAVADRFIIDLDPQLNTKVKTGDVLASIRKRFPDIEGEYQTYFWGAFSRGRKQEDVQLYVRIDWDRFRIGVTFGAAADEQLERLRTEALPRVDVLWTVLEPVHGRLVFWLDDGPYPEVIDVTGPADLKRWLQGERPSVVEILTPDDPLVTSEQLVDEVGLLLTTLYPLAAMAWGEHVAEMDEVAEVQDVEEEAGEAYTLPQLAHDTMLPIEDLEEWAAMLAQPRKRQAIFYGPPGTGKTFLAERLGRHLAMPGGEVVTVQFHPSFSYEDFIEGLRPDEKSEQFRYAVRDGLFTDFCETARKKPQATFVFVIDELNRADLGSVFGELMMLLEYRGHKLPLPYSQRQFSIPRNVVVLATMNTADRSLALVDFALRRRFHTIEMSPNREVLSAHLARRGDDGEMVLGLFDLVQAEVKTRDFCPGHSYWMGDDISADGLRRVWRYELRPYLTEYWFEHQNLLDALEKAVGAILGEGA
jgi:hypothetical protein